MSSEEIAAVEKNGNYWLSASNTAYHIINPNATSLKPIESDGYYSLARGGDTFYVLDASGNSIKLDLNGRTMFDDFTGVVSQAGSTNTYTPTHVEESPFVWYWEDKISGPHPDAAFLVLASRNDVSASWDTSSFHNNNIWGFFFDETGTYHGQSDVIKLAWFPDALQRPGSQYESLFGDDLNNDGLITPGASPTNLLNISGNQHHIDDGHGGESVILKNDNVIIGPNSNAGWSATQVEKNGGHLEVLWKHPTGNKYDVWQVDTSGNFVSSIKTKLWEDELKFNQDLNGDGDTGLVTVEAIGNAHLKHGDNTYNGAPQYYIVDGSNDPIGLTNGGQKGPTSYAGWSATQVIASESGGYEVLWSHTGGKYDVWKVDTSGNFVSSIKAKLWEDELKFNQDLNGDGDTGLVTVEAIGNAHLKHGDNTINGAPQYYIVDGSNDPIGLTNGGQKGPTSYAGWSATQVIASESGGYEVLWSHTGGKYDVWKVDTSGNFVSSIKANLWEDELKFNQDLNGDGDTGLVTVEAIGNAHLKHGDNTINGAPQYYIVDGSNDPIGLTNGGQKGPTSYAGWSATQVIASESGGYEVLWSHTGGKHDVWKVDTSGNFESSIKANLWEDELKFNQDLNGDGDTGLVTVEAIGNAHLKHGDNTINGAPQYYIVDGSNDPIGLTNGGQKGPTSYAGWSATQVIASESGGYEVLWSHTGGKHDVWKVDTSGNFESSIKANLWEDELKFNQDLNGDGDTGLVTVEAIGNAHLKHGDNTINGAPQYYIVDGSNDPIGLTNGGQKGPTSYAGWSATQVIASESGGYEVLWSHTGGKHDVWKVDTSGNFESSIKANLWEDELKFNQDLNGDGDTGLVTVEAIGNAHLKHGDNTINGAPQYYIVDGSNDPIGLTNGGQKGPTSYAGWSATQVIASESGGYEVLWSHTGGKHDVWKVDTSGNFESSIKANLWEDELKFGVDINLDGIDSGKKNNIYGSVGNDTFDGGAGDDIINGREGHDTLIGGEGNDWLSGDGGSGYAGNDILFGNAGNDDLRGRDGNDQIDGGTGNDQIDGGTGSDTIITGTGSDTIILRIGDGGNTSSNADIITDFTDGSDNFGLDDGLLFSQLVIVQGSGAYASDTIISKGSEYLAILQGIDATLLSDADFETVDIA